MSYIYRFIFIISLCLVTLDSVAANLIERTEPQQPAFGPGYLAPENAVQTAADFIVGDYYLLYNVGAQAFYAEGNAWGTQASIALSNPLLVQFTMLHGEQQVEATLLFNNYTNNKNSWKQVFFDSNSQMYVDRASQPNYYWQVVDMGNRTYRLQASPLNPTLNPANYPDAFVGLDVTEDAANTALSPFLTEGYGHYIDWQFFSVPEWTEYGRQLDIYQHAMLLKGTIETAEAAGVDVSLAVAVYNDYSSTVDQLDAAIQGLRDALGHTSGPFDATSYIVNPNFDNASVFGWQGDIPNMCGDGSHCNADVAEHYNRTFNTYQDLTGLPDGSYLLEAKTAFRGSLEDFLNWRIPAAQLYAESNGGTYSVPFNNIWSPQVTEPQECDTYFGTHASERSQESGGVTYYSPNDPSAFRVYAEQGYYDTQLRFSVTGGSARIGVKNESLCDDGCDNWACFDRFRLHYLGFSYEVGEVVNGSWVRSTSGTGEKGAEISMPYRYYNLWEGKLYRCPASGGEKSKEFNHYFTLTIDWQTEVINYDVTDIENVVFLSEGEDLYGMMRCGSANAALRSSNGAAAYPADGDVSFVTLSPGIYRIGAVLFNANKTPNDVWHIKNGTEVVAELHNSIINFDEVVSEAFTLADTSTLSIEQFGNNSKGIDLIYVQKMGDVPQNTHYFYNFTEDTLLMTTVDNINNENQNHDWIDGGTYRVECSGTFNPLTGQEGDGVVNEGIMLRKDNSNMMLNTYVTGVECVWAYGCSYNATRDLVVTVYDLQDNVVATSRGTSYDGQSIKVEVNGLDPSARYKVAYTGCVEGTDNGAYFVLHGIRFVTSYYDERSFSYNNVKYHTTSATTADVVGYDTPGSLLVIPASVQYGGRSYTVKKIADAAFAHCQTLSTVVLSNGIEQIGSLAFAHGSLRSISIPASVNNIGTQAFNCPELVRITVNANNSWYTSEDDVLFNKDKSRLVWYPAAKKDGYYDIPATVTEIGTNPFQDCKNLEYVTIPASVTNSTSVLFDGCTLLKTIVCLSSNPASWDEGTFRDEVYGAATLWVPAGSVQNYQASLPWSRFSTIKSIPSSIVVQAGSHTITYGETVPTSFSYKATDGPLYGVTLKCSATNSSLAGEYDITIDSDQIHSASSVTVRNGKLTINRAPLTISVGNYTKKQGEPIPEFTVSYSGFVKGQTENSLSKKPVVTCSATAASAPGTYPITLSGAEALNYAITYRNGTLTVTRADATVVQAKNYTITYGDALPTFEYTVQGAALQGKPTISCSAGQRPDAGVYDIVVSKGTVSNYNVEYINGTLTVNKAPLTVAVGNYTRFIDEDNPVFNITYQGFKYQQTANVLTKKPTASCDARLGSPAGIYDITLSGAESPNYSFTYVNGKLTVKNVFGLTITTMGNGHVEYGTNRVNGYSTFRVGEGETVELRFVPDEGYSLSQVTNKGRVITGLVTNGIYKFTNFSEDANIVATFEESQGMFVVNSVRYKILSSTNHTVMVNNVSSSKSHMVIPDKVNYDDRDWTVVGIVDNVFFRNSALVSIELPSTLLSVNTGLSIFTGCSKLSSIIWNADFKPSYAQMGTIENPNLLFYAKSAAYVPSSVTNAVIGDKAAAIVLSDGATADFYCPRAFTATTVTYSHNYTMPTAVGGTMGWETLALPFTVDRIEHETRGAAVPFASYNPANSAQRPFWLYTYSSTGFVRASRIEANKPYLISMPNNSEYDQDYCLNGKVTFTAQNARVEPTENALGISRGNKTFMPVFQRQSKSASIFALNVVNDYYSATGAHNPGSIFVSDLRDVSPFEAYMTSSAAGARSTIDIDFNDATDIQELLCSGIMASDGRQRVYTLSGQLVVQTEDIVGLRKAMKRLPKGVYLINGKKIQIK